ncbi:MAG TPA: ribosome silencing factor [bacterium (Candidatus Stahlbacteria)]|nr:ribosome silencing factor [Candidatus Stahlbacteria bacterium]
MVKSTARMIKKKKGEDVIVLDLRNRSPIADFFIITTGLSPIHTKAIADDLIERQRPHHIEGMESGHWILLDYIDLIVHIFTKESRTFYGLERLWGDAPQVKF